jgi:hypothetical protein
VPSSWPTFLHLADGKAIFRVEVAPPEDMVAERLEQQPLEDLGVFPFRPQEDGAEIYGRFSRGSRVAGLERRITGH